MLDVFPTRTRAIFGSAYRSLFTTGRWVCRCVAPELTELALKARIVESMSLLSATTGICHRQ